MKTLFTFVFLIPLLLQAQSYTFSGARDNINQKIASIIVIKAYAQLGITITPKFLLFKESVVEANKGVYDGEFARFDGIVKFYPNLIKVPVEIILSQAAAFSKNKNLQIHEWKDLKGHDFIVVEGIKYIEKNTHDMKRKLVEDCFIAFELLHEGKTEIVVGPRHQGLYICKQAFHMEITQVGEVLQSEPLYHFVHKKNAHLIPLITPILEEMKRSGEMEYIKQNYLRKLIK